MSDCFIKKIKGTVNNDGLQYLNIIKIHLKEGVRNDYIQTSGSVTFTLDDEGYWRDNGTSGNDGQVLTVNGNVWKEMVIPEGGCNLTISNKYLLKRFDFRLMDSDISSDTFAFMTQLTYLYIPSSNHLYGNISDFGKLTLLTQLHVTAQKDFVGTIEDFVRLQRANGRTTGTITGDGSIGVCTILDAATGNRVLATGQPPSYNYTLSWTATTITLDDNTITA